MRFVTGRYLVIAGFLVPLLLAVLWQWLSIQARLFMGLSCFLVHAAILIGTLWPCSGWFAPVVRGFSTSRKEVWLTLDDGPHLQLTGQTLDALARHNALATFFVIGRQATRHPELLKAIAEAGHSLGNHTHSHPYLTFWCRPRWWLARDLDHCTRSIEAVTREKPVLFRAPVGMVSPAVSSTTEARSLCLIGWSVRGMDAGFRSPEAIAGRVLRKVRPGAIILLHPERRPESVAALDLVLEGLDKRGFRCVIPEPHQFA